MPGRSSTLERRFEGWDGIAHGGILCTILDEVMAWSLVGEDNWGVTARMSVEFRKPVEVGTPIRAEGWITRSRRRLVDTAARLVDAGDGRASWPPRRASTWPPTRRASASSASATAIVPLDASRRIAARRTTAMTTAAAAASPTTQRAVAFVAARKPDGRGARRRARRPPRRPRRVRRGPPARPRGPRRPGVPRTGMRYVAPGIGTGPRRPPAAPRRRRPRLPPGDPARSGRRRSCSSPIACSTSRTSRRAGSPSGCWSARWPPTRSGPGSSCAARAREAGDWVTVDDLAHPYGIGIAAEPYRWAELEQLVYSPSRWERRLIGSTIATMTHGNRRTGRGPDAGPDRPGPPRPADGRRRAGRPEGARLGLSLARATRSPPRRPRRCAARPTSPSSDADGHRAWVDPRQPRQARRRPTPTSCAPASPASASAPARPRPPPAATTAAGFGGLPDPRYHPEPPLT